MRKQKYNYNLTTTYLTLCFLIYSPTVFFLYTYSLTSLVSDLF